MYIGLVISIGLLVDFITHVLLRYYESPFLSRKDKVRDALSSFGPSILLGGFSTFIGILPMAFSSNELFKNIFFCLIAVVVLGLAHGLILLPVVLSLVGPATNTTKEAFVQQQHHSSHRGSSGNTEAT